MIVQAFTWWSEGLAAGLSGLAHVLRRPRRFQLRREAHGLLLQAADGSAEAVIIHGSDAPGGKPSPEILQGLRGSVVEIVVPAAAILERRLDLPGESRPYVGNVVRHQIEALFPWRAADVIHVTQVRDRPDGRLDVTVRATARPAIAPALAAAAAYGVGEVIVVGDGEAGTAARIPVASAAEGMRGRNASLAVARHAIAALALLALGLLGWTSSVRWSLTADVALLDEALADRRAVLKRAADARGRMGGASLEARKQQGVVAVAALEALSAVLPDDTYLTDLTLDAGRLRMTGLSARATELVPLLEGSGSFRGASFYAPMTRTPGRAQDRFSIEATVVPRQGATP